MSWLIPIDCHQSVPLKAGADTSHVGLDSPLPPIHRNHETNFSPWQQEGLTGPLWVFPLRNAVPPF